MGSNKNGKIDKICINCNNTYSVKYSHRERSKYCSKQCLAEHYKERYKGVNNPNFNKNVDRDYDGYILTYKDGRQALHKSVALEVLRLNNIPIGYHIHHRNCDINDNTKENLAVLSCSDHRWLHKQFGNASLWAFCTGKVSLEDLCSWSTDPTKAKILLETKIENQIGVFKDCELLENSEGINTTT